MFCCRLRDIEDHRQIEIGPVFLASPMIKLTFSESLKYEGKLFIPTAAALQSPPPIIIP